jgi:C-terminal processing protease CtpA/Prc
MSEKTNVTFTNPGGMPQTAGLVATMEQESMQITSPYRNSDPNGLPVEYLVASASIGYVRVHSNYDDLNLIVRLFQRALEKFEENEISILIIDMRANSGGANLGLAGFLTNQEIPLGRLEYYSDKTGKFESERPQDRMLPNEKQYRFEKMYLLVDQACASACELESYSFSKVPGMVVVGQSPSAGTEAEVSRGQFRLPEGIELQLPTGRFVLPDGSIFLEGKGVEPTELVPVNEDTVLSGQDSVIQRVIQLSQE